MCCSVHNGLTPVLIAMYVTHLVLYNEQGKEGKKKGGGGGGGERNALSAFHAKI